MKAAYKEETWPFLSITLAKGIVNICVSSSNVAVLLDFFVVKTFVLFFIFMSSSKAMEVTYSSDGKELNIPIVIDKASNKGYRVKMSHLYGDNLIFGVTELTEIPSFNKRFESIVKNMTRKEVIPRQNPEITGCPV
jgi:hypothetical protein